MRMQNFTHLWLEVDKLAASGVEVDHLLASWWRVLLVRSWWSEDGSRRLALSHQSEAVQTTVDCCKTHLAHFALPDEVGLASAAAHLVHLLL